MRDKSAMTWRFEKAVPPNPKPTRLQKKNRTRAKAISKHLAAAQDLRPRLVKI